MRQLLFIVFFAGFVPSVFADRVAGIRDFFVKMPDSVVPYLSYSNKTDMLDFYDSGMSGKCKNLLGGESWISHIDSSRVDVVLVNGKCFLTLVEYKTCRNKSVFVVVKTLLTPVADSNIFAFDDDLRVVDVDNYIDIPDFKDFFVGGKIPVLKRSDDYVALKFVRIDVSPEGLLLFDLDDMWMDILEADVRKEVKGGMFNEPLKFEWNGRRFSPK